MAGEDEQSAVLLSWPVEWDAGAPMPHVLASSDRTFLLYYAAYLPNAATERVAIVEFVGCRAHRLGGPNDEVLHGHPLFGRGLTHYSAHLVTNSRWLHDLQKINSVHARYRAEAWAGVRHYLLTFHDETFEALASDFKIEIETGSLGEAIQGVAKRLVP